MGRRYGAAANRLITWGRWTRTRSGTHVAPDHRASGASRSHGADSVANLRRGNAANPYAFPGAYRWRFFLAFGNVEGADDTIRGKDDEASYRLAARRKLESLAGVFSVLRHGIYGMGHVRAVGTVRLEAVVAIADSGRVLSRSPGAQRLDRACDTRQP